MRNHRLVGVVTLFLVAVLALSGCGPRATGGELAASGAETYIELPAIVLDVQSDGSVTMGGVPVADLAVQLGQDAAGLAFPPEIVAQLVAYRIQHIQVETSPTGLQIFINGKAIPSIGWDDQRLAGTADALELLGVSGLAPALDKILPLAAALGLGVSVRFPVAPGTEIIPLGVVDRSAAAPTLAEMIPLPPIDITVVYAEDGTWTVEGMDEADLAALKEGAPFILWDELDLTPGQLTAVQSAGLQELAITTSRDGLSLSINGEALPYLSWSEGRLVNVLTLAEETGLLNEFVGDDPGTLAILETVKQFLPAVTAANVSLRITFP
jgi:hypothetical protein